MDTPLRQFFDALSDKERSFIPDLEADNLGLILRTAINELDWYSYNLIRADNPSSEQEEQFYVLQLGVTRLVQLALDARPAFDVPTVMFRRRRDITIRVLNIAAALGMIEHGRRCAQSVSAGLCTIECSGENEFLITLPSSIPDDEYCEKSVSQHYREQFRKKGAEMLKSVVGDKKEDEVKKLLTELVYPFQQHYIGYHADPLLDQYFFALAYSELQLYDGYDTFNYAALFGGIRYQHYILALTFIVANYFRHERFCEALVKKNPDVKLENVLTISSDTKGFVESVRDAVNHFGSIFEGFTEINLDEAQCIFEVLSLSRRNSALLSGPGSPLPLIIQSTDQGFIRCLTGARSSPVEYLLDSLRYHFPDDYNKLQQSREKSMRTGVKRVLDDGFVGLRYLDKVKIKHGGRVRTDIDLVAIEEATGTVFLCQLKYQELYGADLHAKHIRTQRLRKEVTRWLDTVHSWIDVNDDFAIRSSLQLPKSFPELSIIRLVISKHYGHPLRDLAHSADTICANWLQFFNAVELLKRKMPRRRKLADLVSILSSVEAMGTAAQHRDEPRSEWNIDDLKFTTRQSVY